jgi:hypothetical protein
MRRYVKNTRWHDVSPRRWQVGRTIWSLLSELINPAPGFSELQYRLI